MKKILFLAAASLLLTTTYATAEWINPPRKICTKNGGKLTSGDVCVANWSNAKRICRAAGGRLPTINELQGIATGCGARHPKYRNDLNPSYQSCYKQKGFTLASGYWSSTASTSHPKNILVFGFHGGGYIPDNKHGSNNVRCVRQSLELKPFLPFSNGDGPAVKKPAIYLYPTKESNISVSLEIDGALTKTIPVYANGWNVTAYPNGQIAGGYDYLFYEAKLNTMTLPKKGWIVDSKNIEEWFDIHLVKLGLNKKEIKDFKEYWVKKLTHSKYYDIRVLDATFLKKHMKLNIKPTPDTQIRIIFHFTPREKEISLIAPTIETPMRKGFTVVEWGGILYE